MAAVSTSSNLPAGVSPLASKLCAGRRKGGQIALEFLHPFKRRVLTCFTHGKAIYGSHTFSRERLGFVTSRAGE